MEQGFYEDVNVASSYDEVIVSLFDDYNQYEKVCDAFDGLSEAEIAKYNSMSDQEFMHSIISQNKELAQIYTSLIQPIYINPSQKGE